MKVRARATPERGYHQGDSLTKRKCHMDTKQKIQLQSGMLKIAASALGRLLISRLMACVGVPSGDNHISQYVGACDGDGKN